MFYSSIYVKDSHREENNLDPIVELFKNEHNSYLDAVHDALDMINMCGEAAKPYKVSIKNSKGKIEFEHTF